MADSTNARPGSPDGGPVSRALRALTADADRAGRDFMDHTQACDDCRRTGLDCEQAAVLKEAWRTARQDPPTL